MDNAALKIERQVVRIIADMADIAPRTIDPSKSPAEYGVESMSLLVLREICERTFGVYIPDSAWTSFRSIEQLGELISRQTEKPAHEAPPDSGNGVPHPITRERSDWAPDDLAEELEIGMPLTGINHLSESPLLKYLGDLRWKHLSKLIGVPSKHIVDADGSRLYATFFYVDAAFPEAEPMASKMENDRVQVVSRMARFGGSMLDGQSYLLPAGIPPASVPESWAAAVAAGIPAVRLSNIFVRQFSGAEWLKKSRPANAGFKTIRELAVAPDSYLAVKTAERNGHFCLPDDTFVPMTEAGVSKSYKLIPERDVNGAGLVYFANYPIFLDICERETLVSASLPISEELCNRRTIVRRRSGYLNNASWKDSVSIETRVWVGNPFVTQHEAPEMAPVRIFSNQRMYRESDGKPMMVSTAEKLLFGTAMEELPFFEKLRAAV